MAKGSLNLFVTQADFEQRIGIIEMRMTVLNDVVSRYESAKKNLDQFMGDTDSNYEAMCANIDEYIAAQDEMVQIRLKEVRAVLLKAIPEAEERISWSMPTYWKGRNIIHFAASKKHLGIYPGDEATEKFAEELSGLSVSKGTIRIPYDQPLPKELIERIAKWCFEKYAV